MQGKSISNSRIPTAGALSLRPLQPQAREVVSQMIEGFIGQDWRASHRFDQTKDVRFFQQETLYAWKRQGRERPGILVLASADEPAVFWDQDKDEPFSIRLQIPFGFTKKGPWVFSATLLRGERQLILEDVWVAEGRGVWTTKAFSERWRILQDAYDALSRQQIFLGMDLVLIEPISLATFAAAEPEPGVLWDFQPEKAGKKRIVVLLPGARLGMSKGAIARAAQAAAEDGSAAAAVAVDEAKALSLPKCSKNPLKRSMEAPTVRIAMVSVDKISNLPDSYLLAAADGEIGHACIPKLAQSLELRKRFAGAAGLPAEVGWHSGFKKYEIIRLLPDGTPLSPRSVFYEATGAGDE